MMSPVPPPHPIYPRNCLQTSSAMAESPRPAIHTGAFPMMHQLPPPLFGTPPITTPRFSGPPGPVLAPLAIPNAASINSSIPRQHSTSQHAPAPMRNHISAPAPIPSQPAPAPLPHYQTQEQQQDSRRPSSYDHHLLSSQPSYNSPPSSAFSSPSFNFDRGFEQRRISTGTDPDFPPTRNSSISTMIASPRFPVRRSSEDNYHDEQHRPNYTSRYTPVSVAESRCLRTDAIAKRSPSPYQIRVRQQPVAARACGFGERDRRVIDPPPIVQLIVNDPATGHSDPTEMRYPFNVVHCTLWSVDGNVDETALVGVDKRWTRRLMGTLVSSPFVGSDEEGKEGCFFCFPDLSCRTHGRYRLRFVLMRLEPSDLQPDGYTPIITETLSEVFTVYTAKEFPGMRASTALTKALKRQGCAISVKKGNEKAMGQTGGSGKDDDSGDEDTPSSSGKTKRRRKT